MIAHLPLASHPCPRRVLVVGGGDGGVVREVLKHDSVENVVLCDIDEVSRAEMPDPNFSHYPALTFSIHRQSSASLSNTSPTCPASSPTHA